MGLCIKEKTPILCPLPLIAWPEENWEAAVWCGELCDGKERWQQRPSLGMLHFLSLFTRERTWSQNFQRRIWNQEAKMQQGLVAAHQKLNKTVWKEVQIVKSRLKKFWFWTPGCPYMCSVPHEHLNTDRTCGKWIMQEIRLGHPWGLLCLCTVSFWERPPIRFIPNVRTQLWCLQSVTEAQGKHAGVRGSTEPWAAPMCSCSQLLNAVGTLGHLGRKSLSALLHTFSNLHVSPDHWHYGKTLQEVPKGEKGAKRREKCSVHSASAPGDWALWGCSKQGTAANSQSLRNFPG